MGKSQILIDTDPGIDDAMAIIYAQLDQDIELVGLTTIFGNVTTDIATRNALALVEMIGSDIPVSRGAEKPLVQTPHAPSANVHGAEGFGTVPAFQPTLNAVDEPAHEFICRMINENPGEIVLCPIGPFTNIALAYQHDPSIVDKVKSVTVMGGSLRAGGNVTEFAEANIWHDPHAAEIVFGAGWPIHMIGLDVTQQIVCTPDEFSILGDSAPRLGGFLNDAAQYYFKFYKEFAGLTGCQMHDPSAIISISRPELFSFESVPVSVCVDGPKAGQTILTNGDRRPLVHVATGCESDKIRKVFLDSIKSSE